MGDELDRAGADVADRLRGLDGGLAHRRAALRGHSRRRRFLEHLLVAPLYRAVALEQVDAVAEAVGEDLDLDVARLQHVLLDEDAVVAERALRLALARGERGREVLALVDPAHALAAAAGARLDQHRKADLAGLAREQRRVLIVAVVAGRERDARLGHQRLGRRLRSHRADRRRRRADEDDAVGRALLGEGVVLGEESVARVNGLSAGGLGRGDDVRADEVGLSCCCRSDANGLIGHSHVARVRVRVGVDRDGGNAHAPRRLDDAARDLAAVGDQDLGEHRSIVSSASGPLRSSPFLAHAASEWGRPAPLHVPPIAGCAADLLLILALRGAPPLRCRSAAHEGAACASVRTWAGGRCVERKY